MPRGPSSRALAAALEVLGGGFGFITGRGGFGVITGRAQGPAPPVPKEASGAAEWAIASATDGVAHVFGGTPGEVTPLEFVRAALAPSRSRKRK